jgi:DNA recombination-mediator protein A
MAPELALEETDFESRAISPLRELGAYEALWDKPDTTFKTLSEKFAARPHAVPSDFVPPGKAREYADFVQRRFREAEVTRFGVRVHGAGEYPQKLRDAAHPIELLYYQGWWDLAESRSVAVVGTRKPTLDGEARTRQLVRKLVKDGFTVALGLARSRHGGAYHGDRGRRANRRGDRHAAIAQLSEGQCRAATEDCERILADQSGAGAALRAPGLPAEPAVFPRAQHHHVGANRGDDHRRSGGNFGDADSGARRAVSGPQVIHPR